MPGNSDVAAQRGVADADSGRPGLLALALAPVPAFALTSATGYADPMFANPPGILGLPLGVVLLFVAGALTALALLTAVRSRSVAKGRGPTLAFALPALAIVLLGPVLVTSIAGGG